MFSIDSNPEHEINYESSEIFDDQRSQVFSADQAVKRPT